MRTVSDAVSCAAWPVGGYFRGIDQSQPAEQRKMLAAWSLVLDESTFVSRELSPPINWLAAFQAYAAQAEPRAVTADGSVQATRFYGLLLRFLELQVHLSTSHSTVRMRVRVHS